MRALSPVVTAAGIQPRGESSQEATYMAKGKVHGSMISKKGFGSFTPKMAVRTFSFIIARLEAVGLSPRRERRRDVRRRAGSEGSPRRERGKGELTGA